ncbi:hypothetical protein HanIR_Chr02g0059811 [Helianthus annuus]|nr:hypothetical protein HanIR_Chr02g0059811 [Helianthus annuus]
MKSHAFFPVLSSNSPNFALNSMYTSMCSLPSTFLILHPFQFNILNVINNLLKWENQPSLLQFPSTLINQNGRR